MEFEAEEEGALVVVVKGLLREPRSAEAEVEGVRQCCWSSHPVLL